MIVADAMIRRPRTCGPATTVAQARAVLADDHVHAVLVVEGRTLLAVVERADLVGAAPDAPVRAAGTLRHRVIGPDVDAERVRRAMVARRHRRVAVVDAAGALLGLLCLKRSGTGFCSDADVAARAEAPAMIGAGRTSVSPAQHRRTARGDRAQVLSAPGRAPRPRSRSRSGSGRPAWTARS